LQVIFAYSELLIEGIREDHSLASYAEIIREQIDKMGGITRKIMMITKYETKPYAQGTIIIDIDKSSNTIT